MIDGMGEGDRIEVRDGVVWVILDRPDKLNALGLTTMDLLEEAVAMCSAGETGAMVITGTGRSFTVGGDLIEMRASHGRDEAAGEHRDGLRSAFERSARVIQSLEEVETPVICGVNGLAVAGGMELVCFSDVVVAARSASFADGHANVGLIPVAGSVHRLAARVGQSNARRLLFTGEFITAEDAFRMGLVNWLVEDDKLEATLVTVAGQLMDKAPSVLAHMKALANETATLAPTEASRVELGLAIDHARSDVVAEGLAAFVERRPAHFRPAVPQ